VELEQQIKDSMVALEMALQIVLVVVVVRLKLELLELLALLVERVETEFQATLLEPA
jgi:hypothetical protein